MIFYSRKPTLSAVAAFGALILLALVTSDAQAMRMVCDYIPGGSCNIAGCTVTTEKSCTWEYESSDLSWFAGPPSGPRSGGFVNDGGGATDSDVGREVKEEAKDKECTQTSHPVMIASGNKVLPEPDFVVPSAGNVLQVTRFYDKSLARVGIFGPKWASSLEYTLSFDRSGVQCHGRLDTVAACSSTSTLTKIYANRTNGFAWIFTLGADNIWRNGSGASITVSGSNWALITKDGEQEVYDSYGRPISIRDERNIGLSYAYNGSNQLATITHSSGRAIQVTWASGKVRTVTAPNGKVYTYNYGTGGYLTSVAYPDGLGSRTYHYENTAQPGGLTGISVNGVRYSRYAYYADGRAKESGLDGGIEKSTFAYGTTYTDVTNALGQATRYQVAELNGAKRVVGVDRPATGICPAGSTDTAFDINGNADYEYDAYGVKTDYTYDADQRLTQKVVGIGTNGETDQQEITQFVWDSVRNSRLLTVKVYGASLSQPISETFYDYYPDGDPAARLLKTKRVINRTPNGSLNQERIVAFGYTLYPSGLIQTMVINGPQAGSGDLTTYQHDAAGNLMSVTDPFGNQDLYTLYNGLGQPGAVTNANGFTTTYVYDGRGRPTQEAAEGRTITYVYDGMGNRTKVSNNLGGTLSYSYGSSGLLYSVALPRITYDSGLQTVEYENNYISMNYNLMGQPLGRYVRGEYTVKEYDPETRKFLGGTWNTTSQTSTNQYDAGGFKSAALGGNGQSVSYSYNSNGDILSATNAQGRTTWLGYDRQRRINHITDAAGGDTWMAYDQVGNLLQVSDPRGLATYYTYDGFGQVIRQTSPDTGTSSFVYDAAGNRISMTGANGSVTSYVYDGANRLTSSISGGKTLGYGYDWCTNGKARLCNIYDPNGGWTHYAYNQEGKVTIRRDNIVGNGIAADYWTGYTYDVLGRLAGITYPSGTQVRYSYNEYDVEGMMGTPK